nr:condensation domain-containing protein [Ktedonosporobacter rubrisoli]
MWSNVLKVERIGIYEHFFELGGDSILAISVCNQARQAGLKITPRQLFRYPTIAALAFHAFSATGGSTQAEQGFILGEAPLTPIQSWFFAQQLPNPHHWNMAWLLQLKEKLSPAILEKALGFLLQQHDALRLRFFRDGQRDWQQKFVPPDALVPFTLVDLAALPEAEQSLTMESIIARLQTSLHLTCGPLIRATLFTLGPQRLTYLFLVAHHLVVDAVSWHILLEDLQKAYRQFAQGKPLYLMKTASFKQWASLLHEYVQSQAAQEELDYWLAYAQETVPRLPADYSHGLNLEATAADVLVHLDGQETRMLLREMPIVFQAQVTDILLTALALAVKQWTGQSKVAIDLEGHGREEIREGIDLTRTVGWFTTLTPLVLDLVQAQEPEMGLQIVKKYLQRLPEKGIGYGVLRFLSAEKEVRERLKALSQAEISFNYLGSQELEETDLWRPMQTFCGPYHSQQGMRPYLIEVNCFMHEGKLSTQWTYSSTIYNQTTIAQLAQEFQRILRSLLQPDQVIQASTPTPAQFPKARTSQKDLIKVLSKVKNFVGDEV